MSRWDYVRALLRGRTYATREETEEAVRRAEERFLGALSAQRRAGEEMARGAAEDLRRDLDAAAEIAAGRVR